MADKRCKTCRANHIGQIDRFPVGADVLAIANIGYREGAVDRIIKVGTFGKVIDHKEDGRAVIDFKGHEGTHVFHKIAFYLVRCFPGDTR